MTALPPHLQDPLPPGCVFLRRLDVVSFQSGSREEREEGSLGTFTARPGSGTIPSVHVSWDNSLLRLHLPCMGAGRLSPRLVLPGPISGVPFHRQALVPLPSAPSALLSGP